MRVVSHRFRQNNPVEESNTNYKSQSITMKLKELAGCEECDTVYRRTPLAYGKRAYCLCCGAELYRHTKPFSTLLALILTALIVFVIANSFPIVKLNCRATSLKPLYLVRSG